MKQNKKLIFLGTLVIIILLIYKIYNENRFDKLISKNTKDTIGFFSHTNFSSKTGPHSNFIFYVKNKQMKLQIIGEYKFLKKGDTVLIKYSNEDPSVAKVIDFYYMKKYKF